MMKALLQIIIVGDTTGGGSGNPGYYEMPNGWTFRASRWIAAEPDFNLVEDRGIYPNRPLRNTATDIQQNRDRILEKAIELIKAG